MFYSKDDTGSQVVDRDRDCARCVLMDYDNAIIARPRLPSSTSESIHCAASDNVLIHDYMSSCETMAQQTVCRPLQGTECPH